MYVHVYQTPPRPFHFLELQKKEKEKMQGANRHRLITKQ
jgi:hypothetical protein